MATCSDSPERYCESKVAGLCYVYGASPPNGEFARGFRTALILIRPRSKHLYGQKDRQTPFNLTKHNMQILAVSPLFKVNINIAKQLNQKLIKILHLI